MVVATRVVLKICVTVIPSWQPSVFIAYAIHMSNMGKGVLSLSPILSILVPIDHYTGWLAIALLILFLLTLQ